MIKDAYKYFSENERNLLFGMGIQPDDLGDGKKMFSAITNISDKANMYPAGKKSREVEELFQTHHD